MLCISKVVHRGWIRRLNQKLLGFVFPWWVFRCLQYRGSLVIDIVLYVATLYFMLDLDLSQSTLLQLCIFPRLTYFVSWACRRVILGTSGKISTGYCKAMNFGDSPPIVIVPAGASLFICTTSGWCDLRQKGRCYLCRNRSCWTGKL